MAAMLLYWAIMGAFSMIIFMLFAIIGYFTVKHVQKQFHRQKPETTMPVNQYTPHVVKDKVKLSQAEITAWEQIVKNVKP